jgi:predicted  nucleic acid-binding Zn-ribbon protein
MEKLLQELLLEVKSIRSEFNGFKVDMKNITDNIKGQLDENTTILRALEHKADVHKAEMDNINHRLSNIEGAVKEIRDDQISIHEIIGEHDVSIRTLRRRA